MKPGREKERREKNLRMYNLHDLIESVSVNWNWNACRIVRTILIPIHSCTFLNINNKHLSEALLVIQWKNYSFSLFSPLNRFLQISTLTTTFNLVFNYLFYHLSHYSLYIPGRSNHRSRQEVTIIPELQRTIHANWQMASQRVTEQKSSLLQIWLVILL